MGDVIDLANTGVWQAGSLSLRPPGLFAHKRILPRHMPALCFRYVMLERRTTAKRLLKRLALVVCLFILCLLLLLPLALLGRRPLRFSATMSTL